MESMEKIGAYEAEESEEAKTREREESDQLGREREAGRLSKSEAHAEANLLSAQTEAGPKLKDMPESKWKDFFAGPAGTRRPTAKDYEDALAMIEELQTLATDQIFTSDKSITNILARHGENARFMIEKVIYDSPLSAKPADNATKAELQREHDLTMARLGDAQKILTELDEKAKQFEKNES